MCIESGIANSGSQTVLLVAHSDARAGRVAPLPKAKGYEIRRCCPAEGAALPTVDSCAGAVVFGGVRSANGRRAAAAAGSSASRGN